MSQRTFFRDDPDPSIDALERRQFAERTVRALSEVRRQSTSSVAGLIAPWGAGKSTTLAMIVEGLKEHEITPWTVVDLNPWLYSDVDSLQLGFFVALREALPSDAKWNRTRERIGNFFTAISPAGKVNGLAGVDASSALEAFGQWVAGDVSANALKEKAESKLSELEKPILFVMDDLDRLTPEELLMVFKLVRLVGRLPNIYYLLSYDEKTLLDLIQQTNIASGNRGRARDYMEKIIQVRFDVPAMRPDQQAALVSDAMVDVMTRHGVESNAEDNELFGRHFRHHLQNILTTPRAINRYFAQVDALYETLHEEVNFTDFTLITFIRTFEPDVYKALVGPWRGELLGESSLSSSRRGEKPEEKEQRWREMLSDAHVNAADIQGVYELLRSLFPRLTPSDGFGGGRPDMSKRRGVGHRDYFDRYFNFGVPGDDVPDRTLREQVVALNEGPDEQSIGFIRSALRVRTARVCRKLRRVLPGNGNACAELLPVFAEVYATREHAIFAVDGSPLLNLESAAEDAAYELATVRVEEVIRAMNMYSHGAILASNIVQRLRERGSSNFPSLLASTSRVLEERVVALLGRELDSISTHDFRHVYHWRVTAGKETVDPRLRSTLTDGNWIPLDFAARNVSVVISGNVEFLSELDFNLLEEVIGLDFFYSSLEREIDASDSPIRRHFYADTMDNRRSLALAFLRARREGQSSADR
ncbi:KAP family P-loop NTPase fold protein [Streptomyces mutabilis]|uniref:KAP family P-loop NTPase fold protein n=1 Tax=Streptomyces mutabilis TaxID=67332 RepID=UPI0039859799